MDYDAIKGEHPLPPEEGREECIASSPGLFLFGRMILVDKNRFGDEAVLHYNYIIFMRFFFTVVELHNFCRKSRVRL